MVASVTELAMEAIGEYTPDRDWRIDPETHAEKLPAAAGPLIRVLERADLQELMKRFRGADREAVKQQRAYKRYGRAAIILNTAAAIAGAVSLYAGGIFRSESAAAAAATGDAVQQTIVETLSLYIPAFQVAFILLALLAAQIVIRLRPFDKWMKARAEAEIARNEIFWRVTTADEPTREGELPLLPLQLEYFQRYQLQTQLSYYAERGAQHRKTAEGRATRRGLYTAVGGFVAAPIPFVATSLFGGSETIGVAFEELFASQADDVFSNVVFNEGFALAGIIIASMLSALEALRLLSQDTRNASRYGATFANLRFLADRYLNPAREAAADGDREAVEDFVLAVNEQISSEHKEWILLQEESAMPEITSIASHSLRRLRTRVS